MLCRAHRGDNPYPSRDLPALQRGLFGNVASTSADSWVKPCKDGKARTCWHVIPASCGGSALKGEGFLATAVAGTRVEAGGAACLHRGLGELIVR